MSVPQAHQHKYANEFMQALEEELLTLRNMECYRHYFGNYLAIPKCRLIH